MALKDFNYKQFFFDHGERIGLGAAGVIALLLGLSLFIPGSGLFLIGSAGANAKILDTSADDVDKGVRTNQPTDAEKPGDPTEKLVAFNFDLIGDAKARDYGIAALGNPGSGGHAGRGKPDIYLPRDSQIALVRFQLPSLVFDNKLEYVETLKNFVNAPGPMGGMSGMPNMQMMQSMFKGGQQTGYSPQQALLNNASGKKVARTLTKDRGSAEEKKDQDFDTEWVSVTKADKDSSAKLAEQAYPMRVAELVAGFPYKQQIEEFRDKLRLPSDEAVTTEMSLETKDGQALKAFRFLGVNVERRQLDAQGKPVGDKDGWVKLDLEGTYKPLVILDNRRFQEDDPKLQQIIFPGLVMKKLATFGARHTPPVDDYSKADEQLKSVADTLAALDKKPDAFIPRPALTSEPGSIFEDPTAAPPPGANGFTTGTGAAGAGGTTGGAGAGGTTGGAGAGGTTGSPGATRPGFPMPPTGSPARPPFGPEGFKPGQEVTTPDVCLIRLFDVTVEPGKTYEYRLQVRMANPSFGRTDAASQGYAADTELKSEKWYVLPQKLTVPADVYYYAVDQKELDAKALPKPAPDKDKMEKDKEKELKLPFVPVRENQTVLQLHRWVDTLHGRNRIDVPVGDWVIAERAVVTRGEPLFPQRVEVPYWRTTQDRFTMATDLPPTRSGAPAKLPPSVEVSFAPENEAPVVVDFIDADRAYKRTHPKTDDAAPTDQPPAVQDKATLEVLLCTPDGKLLAHDSSKDAPDPDRVKRLQDVREWIQSVKSTKGGKDNTDPLGGK